MPEEIAPKIIAKSGNILYTQDATGRIWRTDTKKGIHSLLTPSAKARKARARRKENRRTRNRTLFAPSAEAAPKKAGKRKPELNVILITEDSLMS